MRSFCQKSFGAPRQSSLGFDSFQAVSWERSAVLGRSANAARVLRYICEESAAGRTDRLKEYTIAVEALGRRADFDPQHDTIVRVTVHTLRKRLQEVYSHGEGAKHSVRLVIPPGGYAV